MQFLRHQLDGTVLSHQEKTIIYGRAYGKASRASELLMGNRKHSRRGRRTRNLDSRGACAQLKPTLQPES